MCIKKLALHIALFMLLCSIGGRLPGNFDAYFDLVCNTHFCDTRVASKARFPLGEFVRATRSENKNPAT